MEDNGQDVQRARFHEYKRLDLSRRKQTIFATSDQSSVLRVLAEVERSF